MSQQILIQISVVFLLIVGLLATAAVVLASVHDIKIASRRKRNQLQAAKLNKPRQPQITVVVKSFNNASNIIDCLRSIHRSRYKNFSVIVLDRNSRDETKLQLQMYQARYRNRSIALHASRSSNITIGVLARALKKQPACDAVVVVDGSTMVEPLFLREVAVRLFDSTRTNAITFSESAAEDLTMTTLIQYVVQTSLQTIRKAATVSGLSLGSLAGSNVAYQRSLVQSKRKSLRVPMRYASDVTVSAQQNVERPQKSDNALAAGLSLIAVLSIISLMTYWMLIAATLQSNVFLVTAWSMVMLWVVLALLADTTIQSVQKLQITFASPMVFLLLYVYAGLLVGKLILRLQRVLKHKYYSTN